MFVGRGDVREQELLPQPFPKHAVGNDSSALVTENIKATKHAVLSDGGNNISANKMVVIPAYCIDKEAKDVGMLFVGMPSQLSWDRALLGCDWWNILREKAPQ